MSHITSSFETVKMWKLFSTCILRKEPFVILTFDGNVFFFKQSNIISMKNTRYFPLKHLFTTTWQAQPIDMITDLSSPPGDTRECYQCSGSRGGATEQDTCGDFSSVTQTCQTHGSCVKTRIKKQSSYYTVSTCTPYELLSVLVKACWNGDTAVTGPQEGTTARARRTTAGLGWWRGGRGAPSAAVPETCEQCEAPHHSHDNIYRCNTGAFITGSVIVVAAASSILRMFQRRHVNRHSKH